MDNSTFDDTFTTNQLQMLKVLLPWLPANQRGGLAIYVKLQELRYTLDYVRRRPIARNDDATSAPDLDTILESLYPYCDKAQEQQIRQFQRTFHQMDQMKEMMEMVQMMQEMFPGGIDPGSMDMSQLMNMFTGKEKEYGDVDEG